MQHDQPTQFLLEKQIDSWITNNQELQVFFSNISDMMPAAGRDQIKASKLAKYHKGAYDMAVKFKELAILKGHYPQQPDRGETHDHKTA